MKARVAVSAALGLFLVITLFPFVWLLMSSFKTSAELFGDTFAPPSSWDLGNYIAVFDGQPMLRYLLNSLIAAVGSTLITVAICTLAAYALLHRSRISNPALPSVSSTRSRTSRCDRTGISVCR